MSNANTTNTTRITTQKTAAFPLHSKTSGAVKIHLFPSLFFAIYGDRWALGLSCGTYVRQRICQMEHLYFF